MQITHYATEQPHDMPHIEYVLIKATANGNTHTHGIQATVLLHFRYAVYCLQQETNDTAQNFTAHG